MTPSLTQHATRCRGTAHFMDPFWLLGGLLFLAAARAAQQDRRAGGRMG